MTELGIQRGCFVDAEQQPAPEYTDRESRELIAITADLELLVCQSGRESRAVRSMLEACDSALLLGGYVHGLRISQP